MPQAQEWREMRDRYIKQKFDASNSLERAMLAGRFGILDVGTTHPITE
jgi:hypothetical protein